MKPGSELKQVIEYLGRYTHRVALSNHRLIAQVVITSPTDASVYLNDGSGGFSTPITATLPTFGQFAVGDVNGDGIPDLVSGIGYIAQGNGDGTFLYPAYYPLPSGIGTSSVVLADLRKNGLTDLVFEDPDGSVSALLSPAKGKLQDGEWIPVAGGAGCGAAADFNGDGMPDLAVNTPTGVSILLGTGKALSPFKAGATMALSYAGCVITGDLNGDGIPDLLVPTPTGVLAYLGKGHGTFTLKSTTTTATAGYLALADFNHEWQAGFRDLGQPDCPGQRRRHFPNADHALAQGPIPGFH